MSRLRFWSSFSQMTPGSDLMGRHQSCPLEQHSTQHTLLFLVTEDPSLGNLLLKVSEQDFLLCNHFKIFKHRAEIGRIQLNTNQPTYLLVPDV